MQNLELSARHLELIRQLTRGCSAQQVLDLVVAMLEVAHARRELERRRDGYADSPAHLRVVTGTLWHQAATNQDD